MLPAYMIHDEHYPYTARDLVDKENPVGLYTQPRESVQPDEFLKKLYDIEIRGIDIDVFGVNIYNVMDGWYQVKKAGTNKYFWIKPEDSGEFVNYFDLLDNWQNLANNNDGYLLHQTPSDAAPTNQAIGFGAGFAAEGSLYVEVLEQRFVDGKLWFKVAEITSELCDEGYPWELRTEGWIRAHVPNGEPVFDTFEIC